MFRHNTGIGQTDRIGARNTAIADKLFDAFRDKIKDKISSLLIKHVMRTLLQIECSNKT